MKISPFRVNNNSSFVTDQVASRNTLPLPLENTLENFSGSPSSISQHNINANPVSTYTPYGRVAEISRLPRIFLPRLKEMWMAWGRVVK